MKSKAEILELNGGIDSFDFFNPKAGCWYYSNKLWEGWIGYEFNIGSRRFIVWANGYSEF